MHKIPLKLKEDYSPPKLKIALKQGATSPLQPPLIASKNRLVADLSLFNSQDPLQWELAYQQVMDKKYAKGTRNYSQKLTGTQWKGKGQPPIYVIPRQRGGPSYKSLPLDGVESTDVQYALISKGFGMQDLSSFTLGPIVGQGLCLVNAAFSKLICIEHIEGGGRCDLNSKNFWKRSSKPHRKIKLIDQNQMLVDDQLVNINVWLKDNEPVWLDEWEKWRKSVALCGLGDFHWTDQSPCLSYRYQNQYIDFVEWKKECYIRPSYQLLPQITAFQFLQYVRQQQRPLGLVHPKGMEEDLITPLTPHYISQLFNSPTIMCCQPYVVAGKLLGVEI